MSFTETIIDTINKNGNNSMYDETDSKILQNLVLFSLAAIGLIVVAVRINKIAR